MKTNEIEYDYSRDGLMMHVRNSVDEQIRAIVEKECQAVFVHWEIMDILDRAIIQSLSGALRFAVCSKVTSNG